FNFVVCYLGFFLCAILSSWFYLHRYVHPAHHPPFANSLGDAWALLQFFLTWIGKVFATPGTDPLFFGCFFMATFILLLLIAIQVARREQTFRQFFSLVIIALYAMISYAII